MSDSIEDKLDELHRVFQNKLPEKISEMILLWKSIEETGKSEDISLFHRLAHSLHGSAATYGFEKIGKEAGELENVINRFIHFPELVAEHKKEVVEHLEKLLQMVDNL